MLAIFLLECVVVFPADFEVNPESLVPPYPWTRFFFDLQQEGRRAVKAPK